MPYFLIFIMKNKFFELNNDGWLGKLELNFSVKKGRSILIKHSHFGPFLVQRSFYPDNDRMTPHVYLLHPPGGLVGGDKLVLMVKLESGARALLTTPSATKFYGTNGMCTYQKYFFKLGSNAILEWMPQSNIFYPKSEMKSDVIFSLEKGSKLILLDMLCFNSLGMTDGVNFYPNKVDCYIHIDLPNSIGLRDRLKINSSDFEDKLHGFQIFASFFATPSDEKILEQVRKLIKSINNTQIGGVTLLDNLLVVRLLDNDNQRLRVLLYRIWSILRPIIIGKAAVIPRIWLT